MSQIEGYLLDAELHESQDVCIHRAKEDKHAKLEEEVKQKKKQMKVEKETEELNSRIEELVLPCCF